MDTSSGGEYLAVGVRGAITGRRADLVIIDDPVRSQADAESVRQRDHIWEWFKSDITTRLKPGGKSRPDHDTLASRRSGWSTYWRRPRRNGVSCGCRRLAEADDPLGRAAGAPLWPEWEDDGALTPKARADRRTRLVGPVSADPAAFRWEVVFDRPHSAGTADA